jgi:hypothetical protein
MDRRGTDTICRIVFFIQEKMVFENIKFSSVADLLKVGNTRLLI